ncbi:MAG: hypothetical protein ACLR0U_30935 [Enterocloster clostridioformis]
MIVVLLVFLALFILVPLLMLVDSFYSEGKDYPTGGIREGAEPGAVPEGF